MMNDNKHETDTLWVYTGKIGDYPSCPEKETIKFKKIFFLQTNFICCFSFLTATTAALHCITRYSFSLFSNGLGRETYHPVLKIQEKH